MTKPTIVFYHGNCTDGFCAAYGAWKQFKEEAEYIPMSYSNDLKYSDLPNLKDKNVYVLDYSFEKPIYEEILQDAKSVNLLDHHATAYKKLCGCKGCFFDLTRSGAMIAWEHFNPNTPIPKFIHYVQDGDLFKFKYNETKPFYRALNLLDTTFESYSRLENEDFLNSQIEIGKHLDKYYQSQILDLKKNAKKVTLLGHEGLMVNAPAMFTSELGNMLAKEIGTFSLVWEDRDTYVKIGLRSVDSFDVSKIAEHFNGGGHPQAASFVLNSMHEFHALITLEEGSKLDIKSKKTGIK